MKIILKTGAIAVFILSSWQGTGAMEETPLTPRTSAFRKFTRDIAEENSHIKLQTEKTETDAIIKAGCGEDYLVGLFPADTKTGQMLGFIKSVSDGGTEYPATFEEDTDNKKLFWRIEDASGQRFVIVEMSLLSVGEAQVNVPVVSEQETATRFENLLKRLEKNLATEGKRLENFTRKAGKDTEAAAQKVGHEAERIGKQVGRLFGRRK